MHRIRSVLSLRRRLPGGRSFTMSVSGISSSNFSTYQSSNIQNQQQWLQQLSQAFQSGSSSSLQSAAQNTAQTQPAALPTAASSAGSPTPSSTPTSNSASPVPVQGSPKHGHGHHHFRVDAGGSNNNDSSTTQSNPLSTLGSPSSSNVQQAYGAWQQLALNSDLLGAQGADWQPVSAAVSLSA